MQIGPFSELLDHLRPGDVLVVNDTRVTARRYRSSDAAGRKGEALLLQPLDDRCWTALVYPGRRFPPGGTIHLEGTGEANASARVAAVTPDGGRVLEFETTDERDRLAFGGAAPLPPYIHEQLEDEDRYQTVYHRSDPAMPGGSAAAPTAGLHFTEEMLERARNLGCTVAPITLHVGVDTFRPVRTEDPGEHPMHGEWYSVDAVAADAIQRRSGRVIAVGTTAVRALESAADVSGRIVAAAGRTHLYIRPGYRFRVVDAILTNFHLPRSTLLMMICAFAGREPVMEAYAAAVSERLRFYSFGDAMLIL